MQTFILENADWRTEVEHIDLPSALMWAVNNWHPAQGTQRCGGGFNLSPSLTIDGVPLMDALAAFERRAAA